MPATVRFTTEFPAEMGETYKIQLWDKLNGTGGNFETTRGAFAVNYTGEGEELYAPIMGTTCTVKLYATSGGGEDSLIPDIQGSEEGRFMLRVLRNNVVEWVGAVLPDIGSYEEHPYPFVITLKATDGLGALRHKKYWDEATDEPYSGKDSAIGHICRALRKLDYVSTFWDNDDFFVRSAVDWWEAAMNNDSEGPDALFLTHVDHATWYKWEKGHKDYETCYDVIQNFMVKFRARITMYQGAFWIEQRTYRTAETVVLRRYNKLGTLESTVNFSGVTVIDQTENGALLFGASYEFFPALLRHTHTFHAKTRRNFLGGLTPKNHNNQTAETLGYPIDMNGGKTSLRFTANIRVSISSKTFNAMGLNPLKPFALIFRLYIFLKTVGVSRDYTMLPSYQVQYGNPYWGSPPVLPIVFPVLGSTIVANLSGDTYTFTQTVDFYTARLTESSDNITFNLLLWEIKKFEGGGYPLNDFNIAYDLVNPWLEAYSEGGPVVGTDEIEWESRGSAKNSVETKSEALIGTSTDPNTVGALWVKSGFTYTLASDWGDGEDPPDGPIEDLLCGFTVSAQAAPLRKMIGTVFTDNQRALFKLSWLGVEWLLLGGTWSGSNNEFTGEWAELVYLPGLDTSPPRRKTTPVMDGRVPPHWLYGNNGGGDRYGLGERPPGTLFYPVAMTTTPVDYQPGAVTSIAVTGTLAKTDVYADDIVVIMDPITGRWDELLVMTDSADGDTSIDVTGTLTGYYHQNSPLIKKPIIGRFSLIDALNKLPEYVSDEAAVAAGLAPNVGWYVAAEGHVSESAGVLKKVKPIS